MERPKDMNYNSSSMAQAVPWILEALSAEHKLPVLTERKYRYIGSRCGTQRLNGDTAKEDIGAYWRQMEIFSKNK
jgi:hypothetical protein